MTLVAEMREYADMAGDNDPELICEVIRSFADRVEEAIGEHRSECPTCAPETDP